MKTSPRGSPGGVRRNHMTFQQLSFAVEVAKCASINKAAERLYTHQSNVSSTIKQLEDELGIQIFRRTQKGISVTEEGREFLSYADEIINKLAFVEDLYAKSHFRKQYFSVSSMRSYFLSVPITNLYAYLSSHQEYPIYIRLKKQSFLDVLDDVQYCRSELGVVFLAKSHKRRIHRLSSVKGLNYFELGESRISVVIRDDHPVLEKYPADKITDHITEYPYAITENKENFAQFYDDDSEAVSQLFKTLPKCMISINDSAASQDIIAETDAFFISSTPWQHPKYYRFSSIPLDGEDNTLTHYYVVKKGQELSPLAERYIQELRKMFGTM